MSKNKRLAIGLSFVATSAIVLLYSFKTKKEKKRQLHDIAEGGYETAHDVLFPLKFQRGKRKPAF